MELDGRELGADEEDQVDGDDKAADFTIDNGSVQPVGTELIAVPTTELTTELAAESTTDDTDVTA